MLKGVETVLHPPELKGKDRRRYWLAVGGWFGLLVGILTGLLVGFYLVLAPIEKSFPNLPFKEIVLIGGIAIVIGGAILSDRLWSRLFIQSGYLSDAAAIRILSNRAPTRTSERGHRWLGQAALLIIYGTLAVMAVMAKQWWVLIVVVPLASWGIFLIRNAWKEADQMLAGGAIPSASEERIRYIEKVLDERGQRDDEDVKNDKRR